MNMETIFLPFGQPLADDYIGRKREALEPLFGYHAEDEEHWRSRLRRLRSGTGPRAASRSTAAAIEAYMEPLGMGEAVRSNIDKLRQGAPVVVGGQQAVLWTGPLMIVHKVITILQTAEWASRKLGETVVPVFWIAGEDHDWDEASQACVPSSTGDGAILKLTAPRPADSRTSVSRTQLDEGTLDEALAQLAAVLPDSAHKLALLAELASAVQESRTLTGLFARMLHTLFAERGLLLLDADNPALRRVEGEMFAELISRNEELEGALTTQTQLVKELGYQPQAELSEGGANLFLFRESELGGEERVLLQRRSGRYEDKRGFVSLSRQELLDLAAQQPERLSNNVFTRPLMQEYLFPVLSTVLGPGEIAYWAQLGAAFREFGMEMPIVTPRLSFTLLEPSDVKTMETYGLSFADAYGSLSDKKEQWLRDSDRYGISDRFREALLQMQDAYSPALAMAASVEKGLTQLGETNWSRIAREIAYMEEKTKKALENREQNVLGRMDALGMAVRPDGRPQERLLSTVHYLNVHGRRWLDELLAAPYEPCCGHRILRL